jgi:hydroxymethylpyrimidine pyrophosphatase-like HAD family hydrolase
MVIDGSTVVGMLLFRKTATREPADMPDELKLISTDFDGTIHTDFGDAPVPLALQDKLAGLQARGVLWVINTGRDLASLMESIGRARLKVLPDYAVTVEREIHRHVGGHFEPVEPWNTQCQHDHAHAFGDSAEDLHALMAELETRFDANFYADHWSPLCAIARSNAQMDSIQAELETFCQGTPTLVPVRNDVYVRLSHRGYSKGTALREIQRLTGLTPAHTLAAGDHLNDLPMLLPEVARWLVTPANGLPPVKAQVARHGGYLALLPCGDGILEALNRMKV